MTFNNILIIEDFLPNLSQFNYFHSVCENFTPHDEPKINNIEKREKNSYFRQFIDEDENITDFKDYVKTFINKELKLNVIEETICINKVTELTNKDDKHHKDITDLTFILYLNDNFIGGEFEYLEESTNEFKKIKPLKNLAIISTNKLIHRVLPVEKGERFSLIYWFNFVNKNNKSLI